MSNSNKKTILLVVWLALLGGLFVGITRLNNLATEPGKTPPPSLPIDLATIQRRWPDILGLAAGPRRGDPQARYTLVEFGDFQCPQCGQARPILEGLLQQAPTQVNLLFFHRPFPNIHKWAIPTAEASEAAAAQGKFWPMYDTLYAHQNDLGSGRYGGYASEIGLDPKAFEAALASHRYREQVVKAAQLADALGITVTPTLLLRNNTTGEITPYAGIDSTMPGSVPGIQGIKQLAAAPPWRASPKTARR
ncbi:MAG: thioredoxin domain-containing protein [Armatimonadetes bacterium]|nr:thioredoxin domain-containing protein [Armatimonadota bacterium]